MKLLNIWDKINDLVGATPLHPQYFVLRAEKLSVNISLNKIKSKVLDVGCGRQILRNHVENTGATYTSLDHPKIYKKQRGLTKPDILADITDLPIKNNSYDSILVFMVLAHLPNPFEGIKEVARVMTKGGLLFLTSVENYPAHALPDDYFRYRLSGLESLCKSAGLTVIEKHSWGNFWEVAATNFNMYIMQSLKYIWDKNNNVFIIGILVILTYPLIFLSNIIAIILTPLNFIDSSKLINFVIAKK